MYIDDKSKQLIIFYKKNTTHGRGRELGNKSFLLILAGASILIGNLSTTHNEICACRLSLRGNVLTSRGASHPATALCSQSKRCLSLIVNEAREDYAMKD